CPQIRTAPPGEPITRAGAPVRPRCGAPRPNSVCILAGATYFSVIWTMDRRHNARVDDLVTLDAIRAAAGRISRVAARTPVLPLDPDGRLSVKAESLQPVGSFKLRGAYATISALDPEALRRGVITYSSGNHGLAVSRSARLLG